MGQTQAAGIKLPVKKDHRFAYNIHIERDFGHLAEYVAELDTAEHRICIVTDSTVEKIYLEEVKNLLAPVCKQVTTYTFPAGEEHKTLDEIRKMYEHFIVNGLDRKDMLVALGGGVTGDMTGFAAATYLRGIRFVQVPTTLLSQVDSSIGGKTGVDFDSYKNMVGAFHQPSLVYINTAVLQTLTDEQFACGMGEILKHGLIRDAAYYEWTIEQMSEIMERDPQVMEKLIEGSCKIKREVVEKDPTEKRERALLNFGHTIGHAIEKMKNFELLHGQCVALGSVAAAHISWKRGYLTDEEFYEIRDMNVGFDLPISFDGLSSADILEATRKDKKMSAGKIRFILLRHIGEAFIADDVTDEEMLKAIDSLNADVWDDSYAD